MGTVMKKRYYGGKMIVVSQTWADAVAAQARRRNLSAFSRNLRDHRGCEPCEGYLKNVVRKLEETLRIAEHTARYLDVEWGINTLNGTPSLFEASKSNSDEDREALVKMILDDYPTAEEREQLWVCVWLEAAKLYA